MSARETEIENARAAERTSYEGSGGKKSIVGTRVGFQWTDEVESAVKALGTGGKNNLVVLVSIQRGK